MCPQDVTLTSPPRLSSPTPWWFFPAMYLLSVLVLGLVARAVSGPLDVDGAYYFLVARNLAQGRGLVVDAIWHFFQPTTTWPQPAGDLWMPLPSLLMVPGLLVGATWRHAQAVQVLLAAALPLLAFRIARDEGASFPWAALAGLITLVAGVVTVHWVDTDCYTAYALVGGAALYAMGRGAQDARRLAVGGALGGLAAVTRNDGLLLLVVLWLAAVLFSRRKRQQFPWKGLLLGTAFLLLPVGLWSLRNGLLFGAPTPIPLSFFLTQSDYSTLLAYRPQPDWAGFWQQGWSAFFQVRGSALQAGLTVLAQDLQVWGLLPLLGIALGLRRRPSLWPPFLYLLLLFLVMVGFFPLLVLHGTWSRSLPAFLPTAYAGMALGIERAVERLLRWRPALPARLVEGTFLLLGAALALAAGGVAMERQMQTTLSHPETWQKIGEWLRANSAPEEVIMAADPMAVGLYGERRAIGIPNEEPPLLLEVARQYGVSKVVLVGRFGPLPPTLRNLYAGAASQGPFTLLWREGEVQVYEFQAP